jgi:hypothetical protein
MVTKPATAASLSGDAAAQAAAANRAGMKALDRESGANPVLVAGLRGLTPAEQKTLRGQLAAVLVELDKRAQRPPGADQAPRQAKKTRPRRDRDFDR